MKAQLLMQVVFDMILSIVIVAGFVSLYGLAVSHQAPVAISTLQHYTANATAEISSMLPQGSNLG
jgi:hypothetical protein